MSRSDRELKRVALGIAQLLPPDEDEARRLCEHALKYRRDADADDKDVPPGEVLPFKKG